MNAAMDLEQLLILYSRVVDAPKGSEEFSTAVSLLRESMTADDGRNHILPWPIAPSQTTPEWNGEERRRIVLPETPILNRQTE